MQSNFIYSRFLTSADINEIIYPISMKYSLSVKGNLDNDVGCWRCNPTGSADCSEHKDIYCHSRAIAKTGNDDFTSKKVSLQNILWQYEYFETKSQRFMSQKYT